MDALNYLEFEQKRFDATLRDKEIKERYIRKYQPSFLLSKDDLKVIEAFRNKNHGIKDKSKVR